MMLEMRLVLYTLSFVITAYATPTMMSEDRIMDILAKLRKAQAIGELAINTPTGIYPIKDINKENFREIFNFNPLDMKKLKGDLTKGKQVNSEDVVDSKQSTVSDNLPSKTPNDEAKEQIRKPSKEIDDKVTVTDLSDALNVVATASEAIDETEPHNVTISTTESIDISNSSHETENESKESELTTLPNVMSTITDIDNQLDVTDKNADDESTTISQTSDEITLLTQPSDKLLKSEIENDIEGSGETSEDIREGSGTTDDDSRPITSLKRAALLTAQKANKTIVVDAVEEPSLLVNKPDNSLEKTTLANPTPLPSINLPQFPGVPYIFLPVKSIYGTKLPVLSYLLIPKKYEDNLDDIILAVNKE